MNATIGLLTVVLGMLAFTIVEVPLAPVVLLCQRSLTSKARLASS